MSRMSITTNHTSRFALRGPRLLGLVALMLLLPVSNMAQQVLDLCGCAGDPTLQPFNAANPATYPPGTTGCTSNCTSGTITFTTPPDGVLKFSSFTADGGLQLWFHAQCRQHPASRCSSPATSVLRGTSAAATLRVSTAGGGSTASSSRHLGRRSARRQRRLPWRRRFGPRYQRCGDWRQRASAREAGLADRRQRAQRRDVLRRTGVAPVARRFRRRRGRRLRCGRELHRRGRRRRRRRYR